MNKDLVAIFDYMEKEKGIQRPVIIGAIESALKIAAKKTLRDDANVSVNINPKTGDIEVFCEKEIVEVCENPSKEIPLDKAREYDPECEIGQYMDVPFVSEHFGRIAAHAARQIIGQKLRHAERDVIYEEYRHRVNEILSGVVKRFAKGSNLIIDLGKVEGLLPARCYPKTEKHKVGDKIYALLYEVQESENGGAEVILSRSHPEFVKQLFLQEVPELEEGSVEIVKIAREAGYRTKIAVSSSDPKTDPVGAFVGMRGSRVKNIIRELNDEKIDIVNYSPVTTELLQNLLCPIEIQKIAVLEDDKVIAIVVQDADYATVIGKRGINARLISQILDYELEVQRMSEYNKLLEIQRLQLAEFDSPLLDEPLEMEGISKLVVQNLVHAGYDTIRKVLLASANDLASVPGISLELAYKILEQVSKYGEGKVDEKPKIED
ncbi:transcription termination factor NusA [Chlamydia abortus]|uniref:transcription termination factor NusA n=1 Tax=Chlamydia abortus TaxID=83555 RepID=UPI0011EBA684|nr:transcription termination factor NusA [Chlamydia abortus]QEM73818.1 transcription termination/antitermination protein NusA [Chlamydia abortus]CAG9046675.1 Transcription termination/antitermination protein NusA [Chlamydia abortus]